MFGVGLFTGLTVGIILGLCIHAWMESPRKIKVGTPSASTNNARNEICPCCKGSGTVVDYVPYGSAVASMESECGECGGTGKLSPVA